VTVAASWEPAVPDSYLKVRTESRGPISVLALSGELDMGSVDELADAAARVLAAGPSRLIVDLSGLQYMDSHAARTLAAVASPPPGGCTVILRAARPVVRRVLDLMGLRVGHPFPVRELPSPGDPALPDTRAVRLVRQSLLARSMSQHTREESHRILEWLAATEEATGDTLARMAELRPHAAEDLELLSQHAHQQAATMRYFARRDGDPAAS
jgi:anti-sigma B factor antagonist